MLPEIQTICINYITDEWHKLEPMAHHPDVSHRNPPWGVWIQYYEPFSPHQRLEVNRLNRVWFLDESGLQERDPWEFARFFCVNVFPNWALSQFWPLTAVFGVPYHEIATAAFAQYPDSENIYLEMEWGGRYGIGLRMKVEDGVLQIVEQQWIS